MDESDRGDFDPIAHSQTPRPVEPPANSAEADLRAAADDVKRYDQGVGPNYHKNEGRRRTIWIIAAIVLAVLLIAAASYWFLTRHKTAKPAVTPQPSSQPASPAGTTQPSVAATFDSQTKTYTSANFSLSFSYPADWTISDVAGSGVLKATSPLVKLNSSNGEVVMTIRDGSQPLSEFNSGSATAIADSLKIAYSKPTQTQRANTYITYLAYSASSAFSGMYVTGNNGYVKAQSVPKKDVAQVSPVICITFTQNGKPVDISPSMINNSDFMTPLVNMIKSLAIN